MSTRSMGVAGTEIDPKNPKKCGIRQQKALNFMRSAQSMLVRIATRRIIQSKPGTERFVHNYKRHAFKHLSPCKPRKFKYRFLQGACCFGSNGKRWC